MQALRRDWAVSRKSEDRNVSAGFKKTMVCDVCGQFVVDTMQIDGGPNMCRKCFKKAGDAVLDKLRAENKRRKRRT